MADSFTTGLRLRLQQTGANRNTWGQLLNAGVIQLLEDAIRGVTELTLASSNVTLTTQNGASDQARSMMLILKGSPGASREITVPSVTKLYLVINNTGFAQTIKTALGTGVSVPDGARQLLAVDGTNVVSVQATTLGTVANAELLDGLDSTAFAQLALFNEFTRGFAVNFDTLTDGGTVTLDASQGNKFLLLIGGDRSLTINNITDGQELEIWIKQDSTGGRTIEWPDNVTWESGSSGDLSPGASAIDRFQLTYNETLDIYIGRSGRNAGTTELSLPAGTYVNVNVHEMLGSPTSAVTVTFTLEEGARVYSVSPALPALDFDGFPSDSEITFINKGKVMGAGGRGGDGGSVWRAGDDDVIFRGSAGGAGGTAVRGPGSGRTLSIVNANGFIWGGGGGGGGGGVSADDGGNIANGGGGGGGAGGGLGGMGGQVVNVEGTSVSAGSAGSNGSLASSSAGGSGGAGAQVGTATGGSGGAGGDWGSAGSSGTSPTAHDRDGPGGAGGAAGLAVDQNGGTVTFVSGSGSPNVKGSVT